MNAMNEKIAIVGAGLIGRAWAIESEAGETAHTACVGFGVERLTLALFRHHGFIVADWPESVRHVLGF